MQLVAYTSSDDVTQWRVIYIDLDYKSEEHGKGK
jgi:hypothetical protein